MKLINHFLILFLIISLTSEISIDDYSIEPFLNDLKKNGLFEIIESIKKAYCQDVAIISCEELNENRKGNCKNLVIKYMPEYKCPNKIRGSIPFIKQTCSKFDTKIKLDQILNQKQLESIYQRIIRKKGKYHCFSLILKKIKNLNKIL